jgi:succinylarginine dihydrolase
VIGHRGRRQICLAGRFERRSISPSHHHLPPVAFPSNLLSPATLELHEFTDPRGDSEFDRFRDIRPPGANCKTRTDLPGFQDFKTSVGRSGRGILRGSGDLEDAQAGTESGSTHEGLARGIDDLFDQRGVWLLDLPADADTNLTTNLNVGGAEASVGHFDRFQPVRRIHHSQRDGMLHLTEPRDLRQGGGRREPWLLRTGADGTFRTASLGSRLLDLVAPETPGGSQRDVPEQLNDLHFLKRPLGVGDHPARDAGVGRRTVSNESQEQFGFDGVTAVVKDAASLEESPAGLSAERAGEPTILRIRLRRGGVEFDGGLFNRTGKIRCRRLGTGTRADRSLRDDDQEDKSDEPHSPDEPERSVVRSMVLIEALICGVLDSMDLAWHKEIRLARVRWRATIECSDVDSRILPRKRVHLHFSAGISLGYAATMPSGTHPVREANFDSIVGPTHNYAGLSPGNVASASNQGEISRPREAALQGLAKMRSLAELGLVQGWLPPHERPDLELLRAKGFSGDDSTLLATAAAEAPHLLAQASSSSFMWAANAATVAPAVDTDDHRLHMVVANLQTMPHRRIESPTTERILRRVFPDESRVQVHAAIQGDGLTDEGAANHTRLACGDAPGIHFFVYGVGDDPSQGPQQFVARQTLAASRAVADLLRVPESRRVFAQQNPAAIDAGVFHNDVIAVGNGRVLLFHEAAFLNQDPVLAELDRRLDGSLIPIPVAASEVSLQEAVRSYLFNSQLVSLPDGSMCLICPAECRETPAVSSLLDRLVARSDNPIEDVQVFDLRQSMRNGGGPACLRLRIPLDEQDLRSVHPPCLYSPERYERLVAWVEHWYPEEINDADLADPRRLQSVRDALDALTKILELPGLYAFQR